MKQAIKGKHVINAEGFVTGGQTTGLGIQIDWQDGALGEGNPPNGAFVEGVIAAAIDRLQAFQNQKTTCRENALAITKLEEALHWLNARTENRKARGVEGKHAP